MYRLNLTVVRGYDSRNKDTNADFGYGWDLRLTGAKISESSKSYENWDAVQSSGMLSNYRLNETKPHQVAIDWGNGKVDKFNMSLSPTTFYNYDMMGISVSYTAQKGQSQSLKLSEDQQTLYITIIIFFLLTVNILSPQAIS